MIGGLGCSGKTTFAKKLADTFGYWWYKCDDIYFPVGEILGVTDLTPLPMVQTWKQNPKIKEVVKECYEGLLKDVTGTVVLESGSLFWNKEELEIIKDILIEKGCTFRYICLMPDYEQWLKNRSKRIETGGHCPEFLDEDDYKALCLEYRMYLPPNTILIRDILNIECSPTGGTNYQAESFSDPKWEVFSFPTDMAHKSFLDLSCNTGWFSKKAFECGAVVSGIDISWQVLDVAMDRVPTGNFEFSKIEDYDFGGKFDYVLCSSAFHYYKNRKWVINRIAQLTDYFVLEAPVLDDSIDNIVYQNDFKENFCALVSEPLLLKWLTTYFNDVKKIGETIQPNGKDRPVYLCKDSKLIQ